MTSPILTFPDGKTLEVLFSSGELAHRIQVMSEEIAADLDAVPLVVPVLTGSFIFAADLLRALHRAGVASDVDFLSLSSYGTGTTSRGTVTVLRDIQAEAQGRTVLLVDDILESGRTLAFAKDLLEKHGAARVLSCVLLDKPEKRVSPIEADYVGFECPDWFVVGYGMDLAHAYRELPYVGRLVDTE